MSCCCQTHRREIQGYFCFCFNRNETNSPDYNKLFQYTELSAGFPPSGKIREKYFLLESQGISIFFVESQGKSGNFDLAQVNQILSCISRHIFVKPCVYRYKNFPRFARIFMRYLSDLCREVRESQGKWPRNVRESQGISIAQTGGNPVINKDNITVTL